MQCRPETPSPGGPTDGVVEVRDFGCRGPEAGAADFETDLLRPVVSGKLAYVRFDRNSYSIPPTHVRRPLTLLASATTVRVVDGAEEIARHERSYDSGTTIEDPTHLEALRTATQQVNASSARDRLRLAVPITATLVARLAERGEVLRPHLIRLQALLDDGPQELAVAIHVALTRDALGVGSIAHLLEARRRGRGQVPPVPMILPDRPGIRDLAITPHRLESYDDLSRPTPTTTPLANVRRLGLTHTAESLDDLIARATRSRWSPTVLLDTLVQAELEARARRRLERQLQAARLGRFKPLADFEWNWPTHLHRPTVDRVFSLDFIAKGENVVLVAAQGLGKTMLTKNLLHQAVLAGHSALFITASDLLLDLNGQDTSRALERRLRAYARPQILAIDEIGYLFLRRLRGRPALSSHQSSLQTTLDRRHHQFALQAVGHGLSERVLCGRHRRPSDAHLQVYLDEFVFRHNRRKTPMAAFQTLLGLGTARGPTAGRVIRRAQDLPQFPIGD